MLKSFVTLILTSGVFLAGSSYSEWISGGRGWKYSNADTNFYPWSTACKIGIGTTSPGAKLDVAGNIYTTGIIRSQKANPYLLLSQTGTNVTDWYLQVRNASDKNLQFYNTGGANVNITPAGRVGIGTTSPGAKLDINGEIRNNANSYIGPLNAQYPYQRLDSYTHDGTGYFWGFGYQESDVPADKRILAFFLGESRGLYSVDKLDVVSWTANEFNGSYPSFSTPIHLAASGNSYFNGGNVGIGTTSPVYKLVVSDGTAPDAYCDGNTWVDVSSKDCKKDIRKLTLEEAMEAIKGLEPVKFKYKGDDKKEEHLGFIGEDVPDLVKTNGGKNLRAMDIVAVLVEVVKTQQKEIEGLKSKLGQ